MQKLFDFKVVNLTLGHPVQCIAHKCIVLYRRTQAQWQNLNKAVRPAQSVARNPVYDLFPLLALSNISCMVLLAKALG